MTRSTLKGLALRVTVATALSLGLLALGAGVAGASSSHHTRHGHASGASSGAVCGVASAVSTTSLTVTDHTGTATAFALDTSTTVSLGATASTSAALANGERVCVTPSTSTATTAGAIRIRLEAVRGKVSGVNGNTISVQEHNLLTDSVVVNSAPTGPTTYTKGGASATLADVTVGETISATGVTDTTNNVLDAISVKIASGVKTAHVWGEVVSVSGNNITVTLPDGLDVTVTVGTTTYRKDGAAATLADVTAGEWILAAGSVDTTANALDATTVWISTAKKGGAHASGSGKTPQFRTSLGVGASFGGLGAPWVGGRHSRGRHR
ncbi:MAG: hypothetical protein ACRDV0_10480 [Acidimicrobiales bacterium]